MSSVDGLNMRVRMLENEIRVMRSEVQEKYNIF